MFHRVNQRIAGCVKAKTASAALISLILAPPLRFNGEGAGGGVDKGKEPNNIGEAL